MTNGNNSSDRLDLLVDQIGWLTEQIAQSNIAIDYLALMLERVLSDRVQNN